MCIIHGRMNDGVNQIRISQCRFIKIDFIDFWALDCDTIAPWAVFRCCFGQCGNWLVRQKESLCFDHSSSDWINWMSVSSIGFLFHCFFIFLNFYYPFFRRSMWIKIFIHIFLEFPIDFKQSKAYFMSQCHFYEHSFFVTFVLFLIFLLSPYALIWNYQKHPNAVIAFWPNHTTGLTDSFCQMVKHVQKNMMTIAVRQFTVYKIFQDNQNF